MNDLERLVKIEKLQRQLIKGQDSLTKIRLQLQAVDHKTDKEKLDTAISDLWELSVNCLAIVVINKEAIGEGKLSKEDILQRAIQRADKLSTVTAFELPLSTI